MANETTKNHPVGETVGPAGGAVAGMAVGAAIGGPVGAVVGAAVGAVTGSAVGHGVAAAFNPEIEDLISISPLMPDGGNVAAAFNPEIEDLYWQQNYASRPYVKAGAPYADYKDAYRFGGESAGRDHASFGEAESDLERNWDKAKANSSLGWNDAKHAVRDGWHRVEKAIPGDADGDGR